MGKPEETVWLRWRERAEAAKKAAGKIDADLAAEISELVGYEIGRANVNHWFRGRRVPSLHEFMALCTSLGADPGSVLFDVRVQYRATERSPTAARVLQEQAISPPYLNAQAKRIRAFKAKRRKARLRA